MHTRRCRQALLRKGRKKLQTAPLPHAEQTARCSRQSRPAPGSPAQNRRGGGERTKGTSTNAMKCTGFAPWHPLPGGVRALPEHEVRRWARFAPRRCESGAVGRGLCSAGGSPGALNEVRASPPPPRWRKTREECCAFFPKWRPGGSESWQTSVRWAGSAPRRRHPQVKATGGECCALCTKRAPRRPRELAETGTMDRFNTSATARPGEETGGKCWAPCTKQAPQKPQELAEPGSAADDGKARRAGDEKPRRTKSPACKDGQLRERGGEQPRQRTRQQPSPRVPIPAT